MQKSLAAFERADWANIASDKRNPSALAVDKAALQAHVDQGKSAVEQLKKKRTADEKNRQHEL